MSVFVHAFVWRLWKGLIPQGVGYKLVCDRNLYFGLGPIPIAKPKLAYTFGPIP